MFLNWSINNFKFWLISYRLQILQAMNFRTYKEKFRSGILEKELFLENLL